jgi:chaperonin cofactor prefoldin
MAQAQQPIRTPEITATLDELQKLVLDTRKLVSRQQQFESQLHECTMVKEELDAVKNDESVYKLHGKVLVRQELSDAKATIASRLKLIQGEVKKTEHNIKEAMAKQDTVRERLQSLSKAQQMQMQQKLQQQEA